MSLTACAGNVVTRTEFVTTTFRADQLVCDDAPSGQLPEGATNEDVANRFIDTEAAGEDCRQKLGRVRMKVEVTQEVLAEINARNNPD